MKNLTATLNIKDFQNAEISFGVALGEKMQAHVDNNFEVYKEWIENSEFKSFLAGQMFKLLINDLGNFKSL
jgi:hypothetical protein